MAVVYFTSNASTGAGSLVEALQNASPGDVVRPDETVFERGATIEIALASTLTIDKNLTLDGGPFRVALNGGGSVACAAVANGATVAFSGFDFIGGATSQNGGGLNVETGANVVLNRCRVCGCDAAQNGGGVCVDDGAALELNDGVVIGCRANVGGGVYLGATARFTANGSTLALNVDAASNNGSGGFSDVVAAPGFDATSQTPLNAIVCDAISAGSTLYDATIAAENGSVVGVSSAEIGFVAPGGVSAPYDSWTANAWQERDLRLLDDASDTPSPYRDAGVVDNMSRYDVQGNFRGRETNGATTCSPGAYETIQADLFWIGRDATGTEVVAPSFLTSNGWASSRFATASGDAAPQIGQTLFVDGVVSFSDVLSTTSTQTFGLTLGGGAVVAVDAASRVYFGELQIALGASFTSTSTAQARTSTRCGAWSRINSQFDAATPCDFDAKSYLAYAVFYTAYIPNAATYGALKVATASNDMIRLSGEYVCDVFSTAQNGTATDQTIRVGNGGATIRARQFRFGGDGASNYVESFFDRPVTLKLQGAASVSTPSTSRESWADDFLIDASDATSAILTLSGQTVYGDAPNAVVELTGSAKIDERGLDVASLTLAAGATLSVDGGKVCVAELTVADGATVAFFPVATDGNAGTAATYVDAILTATESATVGAATFAGCGYFATPQGTDASAATFAETVRVVDFCAEVKAFAATATGPTTATIVWSATDATARVCVERENAAAPNGWEVVAITPTEDASPLEIALSGKERFRIFDGATFAVDSAWFPTDKFYRYAATVVAVRNVRNDWKIRVKVVMPGSVCYRNEGARFLAQILDGAGTPLAPGDVASITATVCRIGDYLGRTWTPVDGWNAVEVPQTSLLETPTADADWPSNGDDDPGPNFVWAPDVAAKPLFPESGDYATQVKLTLVGGGAVVVTFETSVK